LRHSVVLLTVFVSSSFNISSYNFSASSYLHHSTVQHMTNSNKWKLCNHRTQ